MERKVGEVFIYEGKTYQTVKFTSCKDCVFSGQLCGSLLLITGNCISDKRTDKTNVAFKEIKNIDNNQVTIDIPEGMEIDIENSDLINGVVKFKKKDITYDDIWSALIAKDICSEMNFSIISNKKLNAINKLINIARYYNEDWRPNWSNSKENKYCIKFDYHKDRFYVDYNNSIGAGDVFFKNSEDARAVINNSNFKSILNTIYKN